jgi:hypothetical protein
MRTRERWHELEEFPDYAVSELGEIVNIKSGFPRRTSINQQGIVKISMYKNGRELITRSVAVIVAEAFCEGQTEFFNTPIHLDGDRLNCRADNLMWRPRWFAVQYHRQFQSPEFHASNVHIYELDSGKEYYSVKEACMDLGLYYNDVYRSYIHERMIPLTRHEFRLVEP